MDIIIKPLITERMTKLGEKLNRFGFVVNKKATKPEIRAAVESLYNVKVLSVNTNIYGGKKRVRNTKSGVIEGRTSAYKKAIVTLQEGEKIDFYSNI